MTVPPFLGEGRYEVQEEVGRGGMGAVFRALNKNTGQPVAIKIILDVSHKDALALFEREWRGVAALQHMNVVPITDAGTFRDGQLVRPYFVMPFLHGKTLQQRIHRQSDPLSPSEVVRIIGFAGEGLHYAHAKGIIHRDIKPSNIFVLDSGSVVIIDFGVMHLNQSGYDTTIKGTPPYLAPELVDPEKHERPSARSDLFSLGTVCYEAFTRIQPFERDTAQETVRALLKHRPVLAYEKNQAVSLGMSQVVHKAIAKDSDHRFGSVSEFTNALQRALRNEPLPEFDPKTFAIQLNSAREALAKRRFQDAERDLWRVEDVYVGPETARLREQIEQATIAAEIETAGLERESGQYEGALRRVNKILQDHKGHEAAQRAKDRILSSDVEQRLKKARTLIAKHNFEGAHDEIEKAREIRAQDTATVQLLSELKRMEEAERLLREQKEGLFEEAQSARHDGHVASAMHKLNRLIELLDQRGSNDGSDRDTFYRTFYEDFLRETKRLDALYQEARQSLSGGHFGHALTICEQVLSDDPSNPLFAGLKLDIEDTERRHRLEFVQKIATRLAPITDLEKQCSILQDAVTRYPGESQLVDLTRNVKERHALVDSLTLSAKRLEDNGDFISASERWQIIKELHPTYAALDISIQRIEQRRNEQIRSEMKAARIDEMERAVQAGEYERANELCDAALGTFSGDREIQALRTGIHARMARAREALTLLAEAKTRGGIQQGEETVQLLRQAHRLDRNNLEIKQFLVAALLSWANAVIEADPPLSEQLADEAHDLIPDDLAVASFKTLLADQEEKVAVEACLASARQLAFDGDYKGALREVIDVRKKYEKNVRLHAEQKKLEHASGISTSPPEKGGAVSPAHDALLGSEDKSGLGIPSEMIYQGNEIPVSKATPTPPIAASERLKVLKTWGIDFGRRLSDLAASATLAVKEVVSRKPMVLKNIRGIRSLGIEGLIVFAVVLVVAIAVEGIPRLSSIVITATPEGTRLDLGNGTLGYTKLSARLKAGAYTLKASKLGYVPQSKLLQIGSQAQNVSINLEPVPPPPPPAPTLLSVRANSDLDSTTMAVDDGSPFPLEAGSTTFPNIPTGPHVVQFVARRSKASVSFTFEHGDGARVSDVSASGGIWAFAITNHDGNATIRCTCAPTRIRIDGSAQELAPDGFELSSFGSGEHDFEIIGPNARHFTVDLKDNPGMTITLFSQISQTPAPGKPRMDTEALLAQAQSIFAQSRFADADAIVSRVLKVDPNNPVANELRIRLDRIRRVNPDDFKR